MPKSKRAKVVHLSKKSTSTEKKKENQDRLHSQIRAEIESHHAAYALYGGSGV